MAKSDSKTKAKNAKPKGKGAKADAGSSGSATVVGLSVAGHPRARAAVSRAKGWGGLGGFVIAAYLSLQASVPPADAGLRALGAGVAGYVIAWACSVTVARQLMLAELRHRAEQLQAGENRTGPAGTVGGGVAPPGAVPRRG